VAWLYIPGTNIDYPVMQSEDNEYYAHRAADGSYLYAGSLFMDYRCSSDFSDFNSVIYGHNMGNGTMFADIPNYENEEYFMEHSYGWLTTDDNVRLIDFFAVARTTDTSGLYLADPTFEEWDLQLRNCASIYKEIGISEEDNLITLSTCTSAEGNSRTILVGKIIENREDDV
jgi:sortase B